MSHNYQEPGDLNYLSKLSESAKNEFQAWLALDRVVGREDGAIPRKYRELIALSVALTTQCPYCIEVHVKAAKKAGASAQEVSETTFLAAALRAGAAVTHGAMAMKLYEHP